MKKLILIAFLIFQSVTLYAYTTVTCTEGETGVCRQPANLTLTEVQATINASAASDGTYYRDGVYFPAGTSESWTTILNANKAGLVLKGAAGKNTIININNNWGFSVTARRVRITGFDLRPSYAAISGGTYDIRVDNNTITGGTYPINFTPSVVMNGVIDNNTFSGTSIGTFILLRGPDIGSNNPTSWSIPIDFGSSNWLFVEDNTFNVGNENVEAVEENWGGKLTVRHNVFNEVNNAKLMTIFELHNVSCPAPVSGQAGNGRGYIAHDNRINLTTNTSDWRRLLYWRSGTGLFYNNIIDYSVKGSDAGIVYFQLHSYRASTSCNDGSTNTGDCSAPSLGSGMLSRCCSSSLAANGYTGENYPCLDAPGTGVWGGTHEPMYFWNNKKTANGTTLQDIDAYGGVTVAADVQWAVALNRDYCVGATQPASCGGVSLNYTPYTYPHPLRSGSSDTNAPVVTITSPTSNATYPTSSSTISISGTVYDAVGVVSSGVTWVNNRGGSGVATCTNCDGTAGTKSWSQNNIALQLGENIITVSARDAIPNTGTDIITVTYETTPPTISTPRTISVSGTTLTLPFSEAVTSAITGYGGFTLTPSGGAATLAYASGSGTSTLVYTISRAIQYNETVTLSYTAPGAGLVVKDLAGNNLLTIINTSLTNSSTQGQSTDTTKPTVSISTPTDPYPTANATVNITGVAADNIGVTRVDWINNREGITRTASCNGCPGNSITWSQTNIALFIGINIITATSYDAAGNSSIVDTLTVTYTPVVIEPQTIKGLKLSGVTAN